MTTQTMLCRALRELVEATETKDAAEYALDAACRQRDSRLPPKPPTSAPDEAKAFIHANLRHGVALASARNLLQQFVDGGS